MDGVGTIAGRGVPVLPADAPRARIAEQSGGAVTLTDRPVTLVGSRKNCDLSINAADISKVHCAIVNTGESLVVCDLRSRSGTFVNNRLIRTEHLRQGDQFRVGSIPLRAEFTQAGPERGRSAERWEPLTLLVGDRRIEVSSAAAVIGRRDNCEVVLDSPDVSLAHALLFRLGGIPCVFDLGSRSGTLLNGDRVTLAYCRDGDVLEIGGEALKVAWHGSISESQLSEQRAAAQPAVAAGPSSASQPTENPPNTASEPARRATELVAAAVELGLPDLDQTIAHLYAGVGAARGKLELRDREIALREANANQKVEELNQHRQMLGELDAALRAREMSLAAAEGAARSKQVELLELERSLGARQVILQENEAALRQQRSDVERLAEHLRQERETLTAGQARLATQSAEHERAVLTLGERERVIAIRESQVNELAMQLAEREKAVSERESAQAEALQRINSFQKALRDASTTFGDVNELSVALSAVGKRAAPAAAPIFGAAPRPSC